MGCRGSVVSFWASSCAIVNLSSCHAGHGGGNSTTLICASALACNCSIDERENFHTLLWTCLQFHHLQEGFLFLPTFIYVYFWEIIYYPLCFLVLLVILHFFPKLIMAFLAFQKHNIVPLALDMFRSSDTFG